MTRGSTSRSAPVPAWAFRPMSSTYPRSASERARRAFARPDDPDPALADALELVEDHVGGAGGETRRGPSRRSSEGLDEGAGERHELALAARERAGTLAAALAQERELLDDGGHRVWRSRRASACAPTSRFSATVRVGNTLSSWGTKPSPRRVSRSGRAPVTSSPPKATEPLVGRTIPATALRNVDFLAPFGPITAMISSAPPCSETPRRPGYRRSPRGGRGRRARGRSCVRSEVASITRSSFAPRRATTRSRCFGASRCTAAPTRSSP